MPHPSELWDNRIIRGGNGEWNPSTYEPLLHDGMATGSRLIDRHAIKASSNGEEQYRKFRLGGSHRAQNSSRGRTLGSATTRLDLSLRHWSKYVTTSC